MSFDMTSAQRQAFSEATAGTVTTENATDMIALVVSALAVTWLVFLFLGLSKKMASKEIEILDYLYSTCLAVFVVIVVASIMFS